MATLSTRALVEFIMNVLINIKLLAIVLIIISQLTHVQASSVQLDKNQSLVLPIQPFTPAAFEKLKEQYQGQKWLTLLWSVDCPPCMKELALVQSLQQQKSDLLVVIINVDTYDNSKEERDEILESFELAQRTNLYFRDWLADQSRYLIDPQWFGELPRSYFIDEKGVFHGKSGLVSKALLEQWLLTANL